MTPPILHRFLYAICYGDILMNLVNQTKPYELNKGDAEALADAWTERLTAEMAKGKVSRRNAKKNYELIIQDFAKIPKGGSPKPRVGIVGEIFVKFSPLGNNNLEDFLISEGCEPVVPSLLEFVMYCAVSKTNDGRLYNFKNKTTFINGIGYKLIYGKQKQLIKTMKKHGVFTPPHDFEHLRHLADKYINQGVSMGEGWLIPAEMAALVETGTENIVCAQPFGCLPNHIVAKGMSRAIKDDFPQANIVAIDYDPGATRVNQENRIKLMLSTAKAKLDK
jgi:predicted nucleotide-binding protein (sugar kinase/HSP70/actin superfamily)